MGDIDPKTAMDEWMAAKKGLTISEGELKAAQAGYSVAAAIEREAWEKIAKLCGREALPPAQQQAPPVVHVPVQQYSPLLTMGVGQIISQQQRPNGFGTSPNMSATAAYFDSRAR